MGDAYIVDAVRSPIGKRNGALSHVRGDELAAQVLNGLVARQDLDPAEIQDVQMGCVTQIGEQGWNIGRMAPLVVAAGVEMMSRVPMGSNGGDLSSKLLDRWQIIPQGISAEVLAEEWSLSREALDAYSLESHRRAIAAVDDGKFDDEI